MLEQNQIINDKNIEINQLNIIINENQNKYKQLDNVINNKENKTKELKDKKDNLLNYYEEYEKEESKLKNKKDKLKQDEIEFKIKEKELKMKIIELNHMNENINNISFNPDINIDIPIYSFDYNILMLSLFNKKGNNKNISFIIKNNGINQWIMEKTFLQMRKNEYFSNEIIKLNQLKPNEFEEINLTLKVEKDIDIDILHLIFDFVVDNKIFGEPLYIDIENYQSITN